jgi:two-component system, OmpR family, sensor histidine kinase BaeS
MRQSLLWKLVSIHALVITSVLVVIWLAIDYRAAAYFATLMEKYNIAPTTAHQMFLEAVHWYLLWTGGIALTLALGLSALLTRTVLSPLFAMIGVVNKIATGDYTARVSVTSRDEVGQVARDFNRMAESLQQLDRQRKTMIIDIAHELRTPLTNIRGYLEALSDGVLPPEQETFTVLHEETLRLAKLAEDLLQLARADDARNTLQRQLLQLADLLMQSLTLFQPQCAAKLITVEMQVAPGTEQIKADHDKLTQVIHNLLQNAVQYTPQGGRIRVTTERLRTHVKVTVMNTGEGIAADDLPFIFDRFYRGEKSRSRDYGGEGIGLALVKALIEAHGGEVGVNSTSEETRFWFTLPVET